VPATRDGAIRGRSNPVWFIEFSRWSLYSFRMSGFGTLLLGTFAAPSPPAPLPKITRELILISFRQKLITTAANPVQMLVEPKAAEPLAVSLSMVSPGGAAVATWFRHVVVRSGKVVGGSLDAVSLLLGGRPEDKYALEAARTFQDARGKPLPFDPEWYRQVECAPKPLLANLCAVESAACDPVFLAASELLAQAFFELRERLPSKGQSLP